MAEPQTQSINIKTPFGEISAGGGIVFIVIALSALTGISIWEHYKRSQEHEEILCGLRLNSFLSTVEKGEITWENVPAEYWGCLPSSLVYRKKQ
jgi:hypothetical protein